MAFFAWRRSESFPAKDDESNKNRPKQPLVLDDDEEDCWAIPQSLEKSKASEGGHRSLGLMAGQAALAWGAYQTARKEDWRGFALCSGAFMASELILDKRFPVKISADIQHRSKDMEEGLRIVGSGKKEATSEMSLSEGVSKIKVFG